MGHTNGVILTVFLLQYFPFLSYSLPQKKNKAVYKISNDNLNRPFPSCLLPLCQNKSFCEIIYMKDGFAPGLVLKMRQKAAQKWWPNKEHKRYTTNLPK